MTRARRLLLLVFMVVLTCTSLGFAPAPASAASVTCKGPIIAVGRQRWCGYFKNIGYDNGGFVRVGGVPGSVNTAQEFIDLILNDLDLPPTSAANRHRITGAQFVILTMLGRGPGNPKSVSPTQRQDWIDRVKSYANFSENGTTSVGENGRIEWSVWQHLPCGTVNTYYQEGQDDVAPYLNTASNSDCETSLNDHFLLFRNSDGSVAYRIRHECMNPIGDINGLKPKKNNDFKLHPAVGTSVGGVATNQVEVGQTIHFDYSVLNDGPDASPANISCVIYTNVHTGYFVEPPTPTASGGAGPGTGCPKSFPKGGTPLTSEDVLANTPNRTICRSLFVNPGSPTTGAVGDEACVIVVEKPYFKVYGGDISAGRGQPTACTNNPRAAIIGWNKNSGAYEGASAQFAAMALSTIFQVASSSGNGAGAAPTPSGLAFSNSGASGSVYGGNLGGMSCASDYFLLKPASPMGFTSLGAATTSGAYQTSGPGPFTISGAVPADKRVAVYVVGDVFIDNPITYQANWTAAHTPLFQLVVKGNIYIKNTVNRIDGVFIAQKNGATGGTIYTCATSATPLVPDGGLRNTCNTALTVNGAFVANDVRLLRTKGSLQQSTPGEAASSGNIAEVFNFSPALWMAQPINQLGNATEYDSITGLPPVL